MDQEQLFKWVSIHNLNNLISFHNYVRGLFKNQIIELEKGDSKLRETNRYINILHDYDSILHVNTFLMMYSYFEEWLYHCWKIFASDVELIKKKGSIGRFKNIVKKLGVDISSSHWLVLMDAEEVRNCLLHANGRVSLLTNPKKIKEIIFKKDSLLKIEKDRVVISGEYLQKFNKNISKILEVLFLW